MNRTKEILGTVLASVIVLAAVLALAAATGCAGDTLTKLEQQDKETNGQRQAEE